MFGLALYLALIGAFAARAFQLYRREPPGLTNPGLLFLLLILTYAIQSFFVFDTPHSLWLLYALFAFLIVTPSDAPTTPFRRLPLAVSALVSVLLALLIVPAVALPFYANVLLTKGYLFHLTDVNRANAYFERGLALGTYADLGVRLSGVRYVYRTAGDCAYRTKSASLRMNTRFSVLTANFKKYPYDARTATYLGHVLDTAPPEAVVDDSFDQQVLDRAIELSPLRAQAWYMTVNILLRKANVLPVGSKERKSVLS